jgi:hypothetical protein
MSSRVDAPADAAIVFAVWRRSWNTKPVSGNRSACQGPRVGRGARRQRPNPQRALRSERVAVFVPGRREPLLASESRVACCCARWVRANA